MPDPSKVSLPSTQGLAGPYFANYVKDRLVKHYGASKTFGGGLKVRTTLDVNLQKIARDAISSVLPTSSGPTASVVVLNAQTGDVLAMVGGENYHKSQFNLATQGERQPGSSFKPCVEGRDRTIEHPHVVETRDDQRGRAAVASEQLRGRSARADRSDESNRILGQLGLLAADGDRRPAQRA
jgi:hypothetical protein